MKPLAIIPARGGSKGIPHKNIVPLGGRPLIEWTISAALEAGIPAERILLSTDDEAIADAARRAALPVPYMRPAELAADTTPTRDALLHAMEWAEANGIDFDTVILLQPTSPLRSADDINACIDAYCSRFPDVDMAMTAFPSRANPYYDCFEEDADGFIHVSKGDGLLTRRQDAPPCWQLNGAVYVINADSLRAMPLGAMPRRVISKMDAERSVDIDSPLDLAIAETLLAR